MSDISPAPGRYQQLPLLSSLPSDFRARPRDFWLVIRLWQAVHKWFGKESRPPKLPELSDEMYHLDRQASGWGTRSIEKLRHDYPAYVPKPSSLTRSSQPPLELRPYLPEFFPEPVAEPPPADPPSDGSAEFSGWDLLARNPKTGETRVVGKLSEELKRLGPLAAVYCALHLCALLAGVAHT